jgi:hypothetical protein
MGNRIGMEQLAKLQEIMRSKPNLVSLCGIADDATEADLSGLRMDADDAAILASELPDKGTMTKFDISNNPTITNEYDDGSGEEYSEGITALGKAFKSNTSIVELNVAGLVGKHSNAGPKVAALIADAIKDMRALTKFDISSNYI